MSSEGWILFFCDLLCFLWNLSLRANPIDVDFERWEKKIMSNLRNKRYEGDPIHSQENYYIGITDLANCNSCY